MFQSGDVIFERWMTLTFREGLIILCWMIDILYGGCGIFICPVMRIKYSYIFRWSCFLQGLQVRGAILKSLLYKSDASQCLIFEVYVIYLDRASTKGI